MGSMRSGDQGGSKVSSISALSMPSTSSTATRASSTICGAAGQKGVVRDMTTWACGPSMAMS